LEETHGHRRRTEGKDSARFERARKRFGDAYDRRPPEDRLIDCRIALEALVLSDSNQELSYKAAMRIARLLGQSGDERLTLFERVKRLYNARSTVAHGGEVDEPSALADEAHEILRRVLVGWLATDALRSPSEMDAALLA
jgi:hypothetical protein